MARRTQADTSETGPVFRTRLLEINSEYVWDFPWVQRALRFAQAHGLNTLALQRNDIIDQVVFPGRYFGADRRTYRNIFERYQDMYRTLYRYTPTRRSGPLQRRDYLRRVVHEARRYGIDVYLQNKELWFPEILLELHPELWKNGTVCATAPFWWEFVRTKYTELFEDLPGLAGIITAPATGESRVSISANRCTCARCRSTAPREWYRQLLEAMYEPIARVGKRLVVRDFVFDAAAQAEIVAAMEALPADVVIELKNTPHDYYPTFPDNPRIGRVGTHEQWIEFDVLGQYFGWGIGISVMTEDIRTRFRYARAHGASGVVFRTDWEGLEAHTTFHTPNVVSLYAGAALAQDPETPGAAIVGQWLEQEALLRPGLAPAARLAAADRVARVLGQTWDVVRRSLYMNDCVFSDSSNLPVSLDHAWWLAEEKNSLKDWDPSRAGALRVDDPDNVRRLLEEKDEALCLVERLCAEVAGLGDVLSDGAHQDLVTRFDVFRRYTAAFRAAGHACVLTKAVCEGGTGDRSPWVRDARATLDARLNDLETLAVEFDALAQSTSLSHVVYMLLSPERLRALADDLRARLQ